MARIGLFGGSFDPPHWGHVRTVQAVIESNLVDQVWLVPTGQHRDKTHVASPIDRKCMIEIVMSSAFPMTQRVQAWYGQLDRPHQVSATIDLLEDLQKRFPKDEFAVIIGSDLTRKVRTWSRANDLKRAAHWLIVPRHGHPVRRSALRGFHYTVLDRHDVPDIASSVVREELRRGGTVGEWVPAGVAAYIRRGRLYARAASGKRVDERMALYQGRFLRMEAKGGWEYVRRSNATGVVGLVPVTADGKIILVEQYRTPVDRKVIELPAGLVNDETKGESFLLAAKRELEEETGYRAQKVTRVMQGPSSSGLTSELIDIVLATGLRKVSRGGGVAGENIRVHAVPLAKVHAWLDRQRRHGKLIDTKIYAGLYWVGAIKGQP